MNGEMLWKKLNDELKNQSIEIRTNPRINRDGLWFKVYLEMETVYVDNSEIHIPSTRMKMRRKISIKDFQFVSDHYERWKNDELNIRHIVSRGSRNTAYIFGIVERFS